MGYDISNALVRKLPPAERKTPTQIGKTLLSLQGGLCRLCDGEMDPQTDTLQLDHITAESEGGQTILDNLALTHEACNKAKREFSEEVVAPYLKLRRFIRDKGNRVKYDTVLAHFDIEPQPTRLSLTETKLTLHFGDGTSSTAPIYRECVKDKELKYSFIEVPVVALFNDGEVQPRIIRHAQVFSIYKDLAKNPLHEPPSCRLGDVGEDERAQILMFDGQHKTVASLMHERQKVAIKLYLNINKDEANFLVNSIQAKIKKLPLSSFELAAKLSQELQAQLDTYEADCKLRGTDPSEAGFIRSLSSEDRKRATAALKSSLIEEILQSDQFHLTKYVDLKGLEGKSTGLTENMVVTKLLTRMVHQKPLKKPLVQTDPMRAQESENIIWLVNLAFDGLVSPSKSRKEGSPALEKIRHRVFKQGSMQYIANLLVAIWLDKLHLGDKRGDIVFHKKPNAHEQKEIEIAVKRLCEHKIWTCDLGMNEKTRAVDAGLSMNQDIVDAFQAVELNLSYTCSSVEENTSYNNVWVVDS